MDTLQPGGGVRREGRRGKGGKGGGGGGVGRWKGGGEIVVRVGK